MFPIPAALRGNDPEGSVSRIYLFRTRRYHPTTPVFLVLFLLRRQNALRLRGLTFRLRENDGPDKGGKRVKPEAQGG